MPKPKAAGKALILTAAALALLYGLFTDPLLLTAAAAAAVLASYSLCVVLWKARQLSRSSLVNPDHVELRMVAGTTQHMEARIESGRAAMVYVKHPLSFCVIKPQPYRVNDRMVIEFSPSLAGLYESGWLELEVDSPLKAYGARVQLPFRTSLTVLPRVVPALLRALELLAAPGVTPYELPVQTIGRGSEYAETREYMYGDELRRIDWKATARLQKLMVKQFHQDSGGAVNLVYDLKAAGPVTRDEASAEFLTVATTLTAQSIPYTIVVVDEQNRIQAMKFRDPREALLTAVKMGLKTVEMDYGILYELLEPHAVREINTLLETIDEAIAMEEKAPNLLDAADTIVITCLLGDLTWLMDIYESLKPHNRRLVVHVASRIWLDSETLEQAYIEYERQIRLTAMLKKLGIEIKYAGAVEEVYARKDWA